MPDPDDLVLAVDNQLLHILPGTVILGAQKRVCRC